MSELKLKDTIDMVKDFHNAFGIENASELKAKLSETDFMLRYNLLKEENEEYLEACKEGNIVEIADALGDILYILCGTILKHGLQDKIEEVFKQRGLTTEPNVIKQSQTVRPEFMNSNIVIKKINLTKLGVRDNNVLEELVQRQKDNQNKTAFALVQEIENSGLGMFLPKNFTDDIETFGAIPAPGLQQQQLAQTVPTGQNGSSGGTPSGGGTSTY